MRIRQLIGSNTTDTPGGGAGKIPAMPIIVQGRKLAVAETPGHGTEGAATGGLITTAPPQHNRSRSVKLIEVQL